MIDLKKSISKQEYNLTLGKLISIKQEEFKILKKLNKGLSNTGEPSEFSLSEIIVFVGNRLNQLV